MVLPGTNDGGLEGPRKRAKYDHTQTEVPPALAKELRSIRASLSDSNPQNVTSALFALAQRLIVKEGEHPLSPDDSRVQLAAAWSQSSTGLPELFDIWGRCAPKEAAAPLSVLARILFLLNLDEATHGSGSNIIKSILLSPNIHRITSYFGSTERNLSFWACRVLGVVSEFNNGQFRREIFDVFPWGHSALWPMLSMRRKDSSAEGYGLNNPPDIRTTLVLLILSFIHPSTHTSIKLPLLDKGDAFSSIFRDIGKDSYALARRILDVSWEGIWGDSRIPFGTKIAAFGDPVLTGISKLYGRYEEEGPKGEPSIAEIAHHFLLALCTRPGSGVCFKSRGWYPRNFDTRHQHLVPQDDHHTARRQENALYNRVLPAFVKTLKPNDDPRQQELVLKIFEAAPELISGYWQASNMTLEPRLSSRWITNIALATKIIALPSPLWSFRSTTSRTPSSSATLAPYVHSPPPIQAILDSIVPNTLSKAALIKGLRSSSAVVRHLTASLLAHSIKKVGEITEEMKRASEGLEEDEATGSWALGRQTLLKEVQARIPELAEISRLLDLEGGKSGHDAEGVGKNKKQKGKATPSTSAPIPPLRPPSTLVHEVASRLMLYYHQYLPNSAAESHIGLRNVVAPILEGEESRKGGDQSHRQPPLRIVSQLHGVRLLEKLESYDWSVKIGPKTALFHVLQKQMTTPHVAIRDAASSLLQSFFSRSLIFEHDPDEIQLWLASFPRGLRKQGAIAPDGTALSDEVDGFLAFFDSCLSRCLKTPYRYLEEGLGIVSQIEGTEESKAAYTPSEVPSPLLFTILEELRYRIGKEKGSISSDILTVFVFLRRFFLLLLGKQPDLRYVSHLARGLERSAEIEGWSGVIFNAVQRELKILRRCLDFGRTADDEMPSTASPGILKEFMSPSIGQGLSWQYQVSIFIDRLRFDPTVESEDVVMLMASTLVSLPGSHEAVRELLLNVFSPGVLWALLEYDDEIGETARQSVPFHWAFVQATDATLKSDENVRILASIFRAEAKRFASSASRNTNLVSLRVQEEISKDVPLAQSCGPSVLRMLNLALGELPRQVTSPAVRQLFSTDFIREICSSEGDLYLDLTANIRGLLSESSDDDKELVQGICAYWSSIITSAPAQVHSSAIPHVVQWVPFMSIEHLLSCLDVTLSSLHLEGATAHTVTPLLEGLLYAIMKLPPNATYEALSTRAKALVLLSLESSTSSPLISEAIRFVMESALPLGLDPTAPALDATTDVEKLASVASARWRRPFAGDITLDLFEGIVGKGEWSQSSILTATALLYQSPRSRIMFAEWTASSCDALLKEALPVVSAFLDALDTPLDGAPKTAVETIATRFSSLAKDVFTVSVSPRRKELSSYCIVSLVRLLPQQAKEFRRSLTAVIESAAPAAVLEPEAIVLLERLAKEHPRWAVSEGPFDAAVEAGLKWVVRRFAEDKTEKPAFLHSLEILRGLLRHTTEVKPYLAEPVLTAAVQHRLDRVEPMRFAAQLACNVTLKPPNTNRLIQSIVQHPHFQLHVRQTTDPSARDALVSLLHALFTAHPHATCQPNGIASLVSLYTGTLSLADRRMLAVFQLFERTRKVSVASVLSRWSGKPGSGPSGGAFEAVVSFDGAKMERTFVEFPQERGVGVDRVEQRVDGDGEGLYDPVFVMLLLAACVNEGCIKTGISWVEVGRTNVLSVVVAGLSSKEGDVRRMVIGVLGLVWRALQKAAFHERDQTLFVLNRIRHFIPAPDPSNPHAAPPRLPTCTSLLFAHTLHSIFHPSTFFYPVAMRFLLQRPTFNPHDVPLVFEMLFKGSENWKQHRRWMVGYLRDSMRGKRDWAVLRRRHVWDLLASVWQDSGHDPALRLEIPEVFLRFTANGDAVASLVQRSSLLNWMENQRSTLLEGEELAWAMVIENVLTMSDHEKLDASTVGGWRLSVSRNLDALLKRKGSIRLLAVVSRCLLRLAASQSSVSFDLSHHLEAATTWLKEVESQVRIEGPPKEPRYRKPPPAPFTALPTTASTAEEATDVAASGATVQTLWQLTMTMPPSEGNLGTWDALSSRLLAWHSITPASEVGEWSRREVIRCMSV